MTEEGFQGKWATSAPEFTSPQPEILDWSQGVPVPSVPVQQFPTEEWSAQPAAEDCSAAPMAQPLSGLQLLFLKLSKWKWVDGK